MSGFASLEAEIQSAFCIAVVANGMTIRYADENDPGDIFCRFSERHYGPATVESVREWVKDAKALGAKSLVLHRELRVSEEDGDPRWHLSVMPISRLPAGKDFRIVPVQDVSGWVAPPGVTHVRIECVPGFGGGGGGGT